MSKVIHLHFTHDVHIFLKYNYTFYSFAISKNCIHTQNIDIYPILSSQVPYPTRLLWSYPARMFFNGSTHISMVLRGWSWYIRFLSWYPELIPLLVGRGISTGPKWVIRRRILLKSSEPTRTLQRLLFLFLVLLLEMTAIHSFIHSFFIIIIIIKRLPINFQYLLFLLQTLHVKN